MKKLILLASLLFVLVSVAHAQDSLKVQPYPVAEGEQLQEIDMRELPEVVREQIASDDYSSWILQAAWRVPLPAQDQLVQADDYVVEMRRNDDEIIRVRFDSQGNRLSEPQPE